MFDRGLFLSLLAIRRQLAAMPRDLYLVRLIHHATRTAFPANGCGPPRSWARRRRYDSCAFAIGRAATYTFSPMRTTGTLATFCWIWTTPTQRPCSNECASMGINPVSFSKPALAISKRGFRSVLPAWSLARQPRSPGNWPTRTGPTWPAPTGVIWDDWLGSPTQNPLDAKATGTLPGC